MGLDNEVSKLRMLRSEHRSQHYRLEDSLLKHFPQQIASVTERLEGVKNDITAHSALKEKCVEVTTVNGSSSVSVKFPGMTINDVTHMEKESAGKALLEACKGMKDKSDKPIGEYMGFKLSLSFDSLSRQIKLNIRGNLTYQFELGTDTFGNITRINNCFEELPKRLEAIQSQLDNLYKQQAAAKAELALPFAQEAELAAKEERLALLNADLNIDGDGGMDIINDTESRDEAEQDDEQEEPEHNRVYPATTSSVRYNGHGEQRTGTYGKSTPSLLDDLRSYNAQQKPPVQGAEPFRASSKSSDIDL
jgi:hypothetical protein